MLRGGLRDLQQLFIPDIYRFLEQQVITLSTWTRIRFEIETARFPALTLLRGLITQLQNTETGLLQIFVCITQATRCGSEQRRLCFIIGRKQESDVDDATLFLAVEWHALPRYDCADVCAHPLWMLHQVTHRSHPAVFSPAGRGTSPPTSKAHPPPLPGSRGGSLRDESPSARGHRPNFTRNRAAAGQGALGPGGVRPVLLRRRHRAQPRGGGIPQSDQPQPGLLRGARSKHASPGSAPVKAAWRVCERSKRFI